MHRGMTVDCIPVPVLWSVLCALWFINYRQNHLSGWHQFHLQPFQTNKSPKKMKLGFSAFWPHWLSTKADSSFQPWKACSYYFLFTPIPSWHWQTDLSCKQNNFFHVSTPDQMRSREDILSKWVQLHREFHPSSPATKPSLPQCPEL